MPDVVAYTALLGPSHGDVLRPPVCRPAGVEFVCFTDRVQHAQEYAGWLMRPPAFPCPSTPLCTTPRWRRPDYVIPPERRWARQHKVLAHVLFPDARATIWLDGSIQLTADPLELVERYLLQHDLALQAHPSRACIFQEAEVCLRKRLDESRLIRKMLGFLRAEHYPRANGLHETCVLLRRRSEVVSRFNKLWWDLISWASQRDQLSFDYCLWKMAGDLEVARLPLTGWTSPYFKRFGHKR